MARVHSNGTKRQHPAAPPVAPKGTTKTGAPRQRGVRTYYALAASGELIRFDDYHAREQSIREGSTRRVSAHEAREIEARGTLAVPLLSTRSLHRTPIGLPGTPIVPSPSSSVADSAPPYAAGDPLAGADRRLIEVYTLLGRVAADLGQIQSLLGRPGRA